MRRLVAAAVAITVLVGVAGCGDDGDAGREFTDKLTRAGYESVTVSADVKTSSARKARKRKAVRAYEFSWTANTDGDPTTCVVTLRHPARSSSSLRGDHWNIDEVNGKDVEDWGGGSPGPETVRRLLRDHGYDC